MNVLVVSNEPRNHDLLHRTLLCLNAAGHRAFVIAFQSQIPSSMRFSRYKRAWIIQSSETLNSAVINHYCNRFTIEVVMPSDILSALFLADARDEITEARVFPLMRCDVLRLLNNKWTFTQWLVSHDIPCPDSQLIAADSDLETAPFDYPIIVKPLEQEAGRGISIVTSRSEWLSFKRDCDSRPREPLIAQKYIPGTDVVFGLLADKGRVLAWTMQTSEGDKVSFIQLPRLLSLGEKIVRDIQYTGLAEFDVRRDEAGNLHILECNPRVWASVTISMFVGVNFVDLALRLACDLEETLAEAHLGDYVDPGVAMKQCARSPLSYFALSEASREALKYRLADPLPLLHKHYVKFAQSVLPPRPRTMKT